MIKKPVISVRNLGKRYLLGKGGGERYRALRDVIANSVKSVYKRNDRPNNLEELWALKDVCFDIEEGEAVGIIGRNGAGKSTLLKLLSEITEPTEGEIIVRGKVSSLLEVGIGFHPELTGRENILMNGAILGMTRNEIKRKFDEIVQFAEIEKFLDTPAKRYSSGMYVRLAFAVAAHLDPNVLLIDEVLAVGDAEFQKKCLGKMENIAGEGRTVLFVSHNMSAIQRMCNRVILIDQGKIINDGEASEVVNSYVAKTLLNSKVEQVWEDKETAPGNNMVRLRKACVRPKNGMPTDTIYVITPIVLEFEYWNLVPDLRLNIAIALYNQDGVFVFAAIPLHEPVWDGKPFPAGLFKTTIHIPGKFLNSGSYYVRMQIVKDHIEELYRDTEVVAFEVHDSIEMQSKYGGRRGKWLGVVRPELEFKTELL